jgi:hypothetical protein
MRSGAGRNRSVNDDIPQLGAVFWPVGTGDSTTVVVTDRIVMQIDLHDMAKADDDINPEVPVVDRLVEALPTLDDGTPYLAVFALTHADKDHCLGFEDLLGKVTIGELWATPQLWREFEETDGEGLCPDAKAFQVEAERRVAAVLKAVADGKDLDLGDRIIVFGYDTDHDSHRPGRAGVRRPVRGVHPRPVRRRLRVEGTRACSSSRVEGDAPFADCEVAAAAGPSGSCHSRMATSPASWMSSGIQVISAVNSRRNMSRIAVRPLTGVSATWWLTASSW